MTSYWMHRLLPWIAAASLAPLPARAQRVDVCALVACSATGSAMTAAQPRPRPAATSDRPTQEPATRDPWARRFQGRETEDDDVCLLNFGIGAQLARKGSVDSHVLGRTQAWRPAR